MERRSIELGLAYDGLTSPAEFLSVARELDGVLDSVWLAEHTFHRDPVVVATRLLAETRTLRAFIGPFSPAMRHPYLVARTMLTLAELNSPDRVAVVLGRGNPVTREALGVSSPVTTSELRLALQTVRRLTAEHQGRDDAGGAWLDPGRTTPESPRRIGVYLAGLGPRTLHLGASSSDGIVLPAPISPKMVASVISDLRHSGFNPHVSVFTIASIADDRDLARERVRQSLAFNLRVPLLEADWILNGIDVPQAQILAKFQAGRPTEAARFVSDDIVDALTLSGTHLDATRRLAEYAEAGANVIVLLLAGPAHEHASSVRMFKRQLESYGPTSK